MFVELPVVCMAPSHGRHVQDYSRRSSALFPMSRILITKHNEEHARICVIGADDWIAAKPYNEIVQQIADAMLRQEPSVVNVSFPQPPNCYVGEEGAV